MTTPYEFYFAKALELLFKAEAEADRMSAMALSGHGLVDCTRPLSGVKRTFESSARTRHKFHLSQSPYCCVRSSPTQVGAQPGPVKWPARRSARARAMCAMASVKLSELPPLTSVNAT